MDRYVYDNCVAILKEELVPALGCTEPIAVAYASARARQALGCLPEHMSAQCSGNIIKNVKGVIVPTTGDLRGIPAAAILGAVGGDPDKELEVLSSVTPEDVAKVRELLATGMCEEGLLDTPAKLHIVIRMSGGGHTSMAEIIHTHANVVRVERDGEALVDVPHSLTETEDAGADRSCLSVHNILQFAEEVKIEDVKELLDRQIEYNTAIAKAGLEQGYGAKVGPTLLKLYGSDVKVRARAAAAAGSDARMSGCEMPVVINSGSGNQGMTVSLPIIEYAKELGAGQEKLYRALCLGNLTAVFQKARIGKLSAFCGAVNAATGAGAGICYLEGGSEEQIGQTIINTLGNVSGLVCDGAKPSCAAKIASSVEAAILGMHLAMDGLGFHNGEGIVKENADETVESVGRLARDGMRQTDVELLHIMVD